MFDRNVIAYHPGLTCKAVQIVLRLEETLRRCNLFGKDKMLVVRTDNGPPLVLKAFEDALIKYKMVHERISVATPNMNTHIEASLYPRS